MKYVQTVFDFIKKHRYHLILGGICFLFGVSLFLIKRTWLIVHWVPSYSRASAIDRVKNTVAQKKLVTFFYWKEDVLKQDSVELVTQSFMGDFLKNTIGHFLVLLYEERLLGRRIGIDSVAISSSGQDLFVSFDQPLLDPGWSIYKKWQLLDGLTRTLDGLRTGAQAVFFLVKHETMLDAHLDFSQPWPISGFG